MSGFILALVPSHQTGLLLLSLPAILFSLGFFMTSKSRADGVVGQQAIPTGWKCNKSLWRRHACRCYW